MKFALLTTGGTIASAKSDKGLKPENINFSVEKLAALCPDLMGFEHDIKIFDVISKDSSDMRPDDWLIIADKVRYCNENKFDAAIILHGTDTMTWTAAALAYILNNINIPVVMTGSMLAPGEFNSDAGENIFTAVQFALQLAMYKRRGVYIAFAGILIHGLRAYKADSRHKKAFISVDYPVLGEMRDRGTHKIPWLNAKIPNFTQTRPWDDKYNFNFNNINIALLPVFPAMNAEFIDKIIDAKPAKTCCDAIVLEGYGLGGAPENLLSAIKRGVEAGIYFIMRSQALFGGVDMSVYEVGKRLIDAGVIPAGNITREALITKIMLFISSGLYDAENNKKSKIALNNFLSENICDDIAP